MQSAQQRRHSRSHDRGSLAVFAVPDSAIFTRTCDAYGNPRTGGGEEHLGLHRQIAGPRCGTPRASPRVHGRRMPQVGTSTACMRGRGGGSGLGMGIMVGLGIGMSAATGTMGSPWQSSGCWLYGNTGRNCFSGLASFESSTLATTSALSLASSEKVAITVLLARHGEGGRARSFEMLLGIRKQIAYLADRYSHRILSQYRERSGERAWSNVSLALWLVSTIALRDATVCRNTSPRGPSVVCCL